MDIPTIFPSNRIWKKGKGTGKGKGNEIGWRRGRAKQNGDDQV